MTAPNAAPERPTPAAWPLRRFAAVIGCDNPDDAMDAAVANLLIAHGEPSPPVGLKKLWRAFGADLHRAPGVGAHGRLDVADGKYRITVNSEQSWRRQRFTLAHEIGHLMLFDTLQQDTAAIRGLVSGEHWTDVERLCDRAASRLLLPPHSLRVDLAGTLDGRRLRELYDRYLVSWPVLLRGIAEATHSSVSLWSRTRRHENERYAPRLSAAYGWRGSPFLPPGMTSKHVTPDLVGRCYAGGPVRAPHVEIDIRGSAVLAGAGAALPWITQAAVPEFEGMPVPDDTRRLWDVVLLVTPAAPQRAAGADADGSP